MPSAVASAREILVRLHDVMASRTPAQAKLNAVVGIVGEAMSSEVCSIYLLRDGVLELYATRGLAEAAVHVTTLALDTRIAAYLLDPAESRYLLAELLPRYTRFELATEEASVRGQLDFEGTAGEAIARKAASDDGNIRTVHDRIQVTVTSRHASSTSLAPPMNSCHLLNRRG